MAVTTLKITGMHCAGCVGSVEKSLAAISGVTDASANLALGTARIEYDQPATSGQLVDAVTLAGYGADLVDDGFIPDMQEPYVALGWKLWAAAVAVAIIMVLMAWKSPASAWLQLLLAGPIQVLLGAPFYRGALAAIRRFRADMDSLVALGTTVAFLYSLIATLLGHQPVYFETAAMILVLITIGRLLEQRTRTNALCAIAGLAKMQPAQATVIRRGEQMDIPAEQVVLGDSVLVRPGQRVPVDGKVASGNSTIDQSLVTGESQPVEVSPGDTVVAGAISHSGAFHMRATATGADTVLAQIVQLVHQALSAKARVQRLVDSVAAVFVPVVIFIALLTLVVWLLFGAALSDALRPVVAVLIVACPCALGLATPTAIMVAAGLGAQRGILIKDPAALEQAGRITHVVLDKTGTLTTGRLAVGQIISTDRSIGVDKLLRLAASIEQFSEHPIGRAIVDYAGQRNIELATVVEFQNITTGAVAGRIGVDRIIVGRLPALRDLQVKGVDELALRCEEVQDGYCTVVAVAIGGWAVGLIGMSDQLKPEAPQVIKTFRRMRLKTVMITGDSQTAAAHIARQLDLDEHRAEISPSGKHAFVTELREQGAVVAMAGDGVNDAPALAGADLGIAMGAAQAPFSLSSADNNEFRSTAGTDIAAAAGHIVLVGGDLRGLVHAITLSRATMRRICIGLFWACIYNVVLIPVAALGRLDPMLAAAAMSASSVCVVLNALYLRRAWRP